MKAADRGMTADENEARLREDALACLRAGLAAADAGRLTRLALARKCPLFAGCTGISLVAFGKAAPAMAVTALQELKEAITEGVIVGPRALAPDADSPAPAEKIKGESIHLRAGDWGLDDLGSTSVRWIAGGHPVPDEGSVAGARAIAALARCVSRQHAEHGRGPGLLCLLSGGGSAIVALPPDSVSLPALEWITEQLLLAGADIVSLNIVRKHLDLLKGGHLARLASPAPVLGLVLSDVIGDALTDIASGPLSPDPSRFADAIEILQRFHVWDHMPGDVQRYLQEGRMGRRVETPKAGDPVFARTRVEVMGNAETAARAAVAEANRRGYEIVPPTLTISGEARDAGEHLAQSARRLLAESAHPRALVCVGETTVQVRPPTGPSRGLVRPTGRGGRNQELVLAAAIPLEGCDAAAIGSLATDGVDGPTDSAGAIATPSSAPRARALGLDPRALLEAHDSYAFFEALNDHVKTGPTGTNVMDLQVVLTRPRA